VTSLGRSLTIPQRLLLASTLASSTTSLIAVGTLAFLDERQARADLLSRRTNDAEMIAHHATSALLFDDPGSAEATLDVLRLKPDIEQACIYAPDGHRFAQYVAGGSGCPPTLGAAAAPLAEKLVVTRPISMGKDRAGTIVIRSHFGELWERSRRILFTGLAVSILAFGIGLLISWRYQRVLSRPLWELARTAREVSSRQDYSMRVAASAPGELGLLVAGFNEMLDRIQDRDRELMAAQSDLEDRVRERTQALEHELSVRRQAEGEVRRLNDTLEVRLEEVKALNREIESFSYSVSHDLRAPLRHINGFVDLLGARAGAVLDEKSRHYLAVIAEGARRMGCLIDDLLSFSRMSRTELAESAVDLAKLVREVQQEAAREATGRDIEWVLRPLPAVRGDGALLRVAFWNLLSNAVKYSSRTRSARIEVGCRPVENGLVVVFVRDNGVGFDMKYASKLFGVFQRLHRAEEFEGTGIGLATVRQIVNRHGGEVWAESVTGQGATFFLSLAQAEAT
jgi:signal transduction histidine kinase